MQEKPHKHQEPEPHVLPESWVEDWRETPQEREARLIREVRRETIRGLLDYLREKGGGELATMGRWVAALQWLCNCHVNIRTQKELAAYLNFSEGRVSQLLGEISKEMPSLGRLKHRQKREWLKVVGKEESKNL